MNVEIGTVAAQFLFWFSGLKSIKKKLYIMQDFRKSLKLHSREFLKRKDDKSFPNELAFRDHQYEPNHKLKI